MRSPERRCRRLPGCIVISCLQLMRSALAQAPLTIPPTFASIRPASSFLLLSFRPARRLRIVPQTSRPLQSCASANDTKAQNDVPLRFPLWHQGCVCARPPGPSSCRRSRCRQPTIKPLCLGHSFYMFPDAAPGLFPDLPDAKKTA